MDFDVFLMNEFVLEFCTEMDPDCIFSIYQMFM